MAAQAADMVGVKAGLEDITECCVCADTYKVPKILPCIHTFCLNCLEKVGLGSNKSPGDGMPCPLCRKEFIIPADGFGGLPKNFFMERLIEMMKSISPVSSQCEACAEDLEDGSEVPTAVTYCIECNQKICSECAKHHRRMKTTKTHKMVQLGSSELEEASLKKAIAPSVCDSHSSESLKVYCADCRTLSCALCFIETHNNHHGSHVDKVVDDFRKEIQVIVDKIGTSSENVHAKLVQLDEENNKDLEQISLLEIEVERAKDEMKQLIDRHASELNRKLNLIKQTRVKEFKAEKDNFEMHVAILENFRKYCSEMLAKGSAGDVCLAVHDLSLRGAELQDSYDSIMVRQLSPFLVSFRRTELKKFTEEEQNIVGMLEGMEKEQGTTESAEKNEYRDEAVLVDSLKTEGKSKSKKIWGLAVLDDELFTVTDECSEVSVYDLNLLSFKRHFVVGSNPQHQFDLQDIVACNTRKCLYLMNWVNMNKPKEILRIDGNGRIKKKWSTGSDFGRLSVSSEGNVTVTVIWRNKLKEYNTSGSLLREIKLSTIVHPRHAVRLNQDLFVVGFGDEVEDLLHGVCIIDLHGNTVTSFGGSKGSSVNQVNCPLALAVDHEGMIVVVDEKNSRLLLFGSNLEFKKVIATEKCGLRDPWRICFKAATGRLYVADNAIKENDLSRVIVLDLK